MIWEVRVSSHQIEIEESAINKTKKRAGSEMALLLLLVTLHSAFFPNTIGRLSKKRAIGDTHAPGNHNNVRHAPSNAAPDNRNNPDPTLEDHNNRNNGRGMSSSHKDRDRSSSHMDRRNRLEER